MESPPPIWADDAVVKSCALAGKACVCLFAFITGYGMALKGRTSTPQAIWRMGRHSFWLFYQRYAVVLCLVCMLFALFPYPETFRQPSFLKGAAVLCCLCPLSLEYWYATYYMLITLFVGPVVMIALSSSSRMTFLTVTALLSTASGLAFRVLIASGWVHHVPSGVDVVLYYGVLVCVFIPYFIMGVAGCGLFFPSSRRDRSIYGCSLLIAVLSVLADPSLPHGEFLAILLAVWLIVRWIRRVSFLYVAFRFLGLFSLWMWFNHRLISAYWLVDWFYSLHPAAGYALNVAASLLFAMGMEWVWRAAGLVLKRLAARIGKTGALPQRAEERME